MSVLSKKNRNLIINTLGLSVLVFGIVIFCCGVILKQHEKDIYYWPKIQGKVIKTQIIKTIVNRSPRSDPFMNIYYKLKFKYMYSVNGRKYYSWSYVENKDNINGYNYQEVQNLEYGYRNEPIDLYYDPKKPSNNTLILVPTGNSEIAFFISILLLTTSLFILIPRLLKPISNKLRKHK